MLPIADMAVAADPGFGNAHSVKAGIEDTLGAFSTALLHWQQAASLMPEAAQQQLNHALAVLVSGDWAAGLPLYESRLGLESWTSVALRESLIAVAGRTLRPGDRLAGQRLLVLAEQGAGDTIWALRFLPRLAATGAEVTLAVSAAMQQLLRLCAAGRVLAPPADLAQARIDLRVAAREHDRFVPIMSLPWLLGIRPGTEAPDHVPYVTPQPEQVEAWRARYLAALPGVQRIVGVVWRANPAGSAARFRTIPVDALAPLGGVEGVGFVNLQGGAAQGREEIASVLPGTHDALAPHGGNPPLDVFAAAVAATDVLLTCDTMAAHLAGAMGHPGLVLMPTAPAPMFYWGQEGDSVVWYPSLRLLRQRRFDDWSEPVARAAALLG